MSLARTVFARDAVCSAETKLLNGGTLIVLDAKGRELVRCQFNDPAFGEPINGSATAANFMGRQDVALAGRAITWKALHRSGEEVWHGLCGPEGSGAELEISKVGAKPKETDCDLQKGAPFRIKGLTYGVK